MSYTKVHPNHARQVATLENKVLCLKSVMEKISGDINIISEEERVILNGILSNTDPMSRTPNFNRVTSSGSVLVNTYDVSVANVGLTDGTVLGTTIKKGEILNFNAGSLNNYYPAGSFSYDATGTEFMIIYNS